MTPYACALTMAHDDDEKEDNDDPYIEAPP